MLILRSPAHLPTLPRGSVVTIGNFDGVHLGHQQLLRRVVECARERGAVPAAITFDPHPVRVLAPARAPKTLTTLVQRARLIEKQRIELLFVLPFNRELAHLSPAEFVDSILIERVRATAVCVGPNFRFGYRQAGNTRTLEELSRDRNFSLTVLPEVTVRGRLVSSSCVRELLSAGNVHGAGRLLGRPFANSGPIVPGRGVGRREAVPTLNLEPEEEQLPRPGVYVTRARLGSTVHNAVTNVGFNPTFGDYPLTIETYLLNFEGEAREDRIEVQYLHRLRDEIRFPNPAMLRTQIQEDIRRSLKFFRLLDRSRRGNSAA